MGKKSRKRQSSSKASTTSSGEKRNSQPHPAAGLLDETSDNLRFEDPFEDEYEPENVDNKEEENNINADADAEMEGENIKPDQSQQNEKEPTAAVQAWNPLTSKVEPGTKLEVDESAYKMHHSLTPEWPALSFDVLRDGNGDNRTRFPHSMVIAVGTQADKRERNKLTIMKLSDLSRTGAKTKSEKELEDEILGEEYDKEQDSDDDEESDAEVDSDPVLEHFSLKHSGGVNRVRVMPQKSEVVATWSDTGNVNIYNIGGILDSFDRSAGTTDSKGGNRKIARDPFFVYQGHSTEGYAMDWSKVNTGCLATGDCAGNIHIWNPTDGFASYTNSSFRVNNAYGPSDLGNIDNPSVEDIQWSPTEGTVFAAAECGGYVKIYDTRCSSKPMLSNKIHENSSDVNVISWNPIISNLMASGGDDGKLSILFGNHVRHCGCLPMAFSLSTSIGTFSVWDLRNFQKTDMPPQPLARFTCHKNPITSLEWHPSDESMIVVTDEDGTYIYDLSIEEDEDQKTEDTVDGAIPPQLLFVHCGSESTKEAHWHPQITSLVMTTALSGYSVFIPSNL